MDQLPGVYEWELAAHFIEDTNADGDIKDPGEYYPGTYASGADARYDATSASQDVDGDGDQDLSEPSLGIVTTPVRTFMVSAPKRPTRLASTT